MTPFKDHPKTCPKCGGETKPWYMDPEEPCGCRENGEHLHWCCERCKYDLGVTATMDAAFVPPRENVEFAHHALGHWYASAMHFFGQRLYFDEGKGWTDAVTSTGTRYRSCKYCVSAVDAWYAKHAPGSVAVKCFDCGRSYEDPDWIEAVVSDDIWKQIAPDDGDGILCIQCIAKRCHERGFGSVPVKLTAGPLVNGGCDCPEFIEATSSNGKAGATKL